MASAVDTVLECVEGHEMISCSLRLMSADGRILHEACDSSSDNDNDNDNGTTNGSNSNSNSDSKSIHSYDNDLMCGHAEGSQILWAGRSSTRNSDSVSGRRKGVQIYRVGRGPERSRKLRLVSEH